MASTCPSCHSAAFDVLDRVSSAALVGGYRQPHLAIDISALLPAACTGLDLQACRRCGLRWFVPMPAGDASFYERLQHHPWYYQTDKPEHAHVAAQIGPGQSVLEVGCGAGAFAAHLAPSVSYRGLEFNDAAVQRALAAGLDVSKRAVESEAEAQPAQYDVVCHFQVLEHVPELAAFMRACVTALRPGGRLIVAVPSEDSFLRIAGAAWLNMPPHHVTRWTDAALTHLFEALGVEVESVWHEPVAAYHADWYAAVLSEHAVARLLGLRASLAGGGWAARLAYRAGRIPVLRRWLLARGEAAFEFSGRGHTVCVMGRLRPGPARPRTAAPPVQ